MIPLFLAQALPTPLARQIYLNLTNLSQIPDPLAQQSDAILAIAYTLTISGFLLHFWANRDNPAPGFGTLLRCLIVIACITLLPLLRQLVITVFYYIPEQLIRDLGGVNFVGDRIREWVLASSRRANQATLSFWQLGFDKLFQWVVGTTFSAIATGASFIILPFYFIQRFGEMIGFAFMPVAVACLTIPSLAGRATNYILSILSVLTWPLGFALASVAANAVLDIATASPFAEDSGMLFLFVTPFIASTVLIAGITSTPLFAYYMFTLGGAQMPTTGATQLGSAAQSMASTAGRMVSGKLGDKV